MDSILELRVDINKIVEAIEDEVDTFIISRTHPNRKIRRLIGESFIERAEKTSLIASKMAEKYGK